MRLTLPQGLKHAIAQVLGCPWQRERCTVHFLRYRLGHCAQSQQPMISAAIRGCRHRPSQAPPFRRTVRSPTIMDATVGGTAFTRFRPNPDYTTPRDVTAILALDGSSTAEGELWQLRTAWMFRHFETVLSGPGAGVKSLVEEREG